MTEAKDIDGFIAEAYKKNKGVMPREYIDRDIAEISFKAGYDKALAQLAGMTEECKQMGRKEVVEWLEEQGTDEANGKLYVFVGADLQAKLKDWGIKQ